MFILENSTGANLHFNETQLKLIYDTMQVEIYRETLDFYILVPYTDNLNSRYFLTTQLTTRCEHAILSICFSGMECTEFAAWLSLPYTET